MVGTHVDFPEIADDNPEETMINLKRILVTTDLSEFSLAAMEYATSLAVLYGADLHVLHVTDVFSPVSGLQGPDVDTDVYGQRSAAISESELRKVIRPFSQPGLRVVPVVRIGTPAGEITRYARENGFDLIIMATHGRTGLAHMVLGSVAEKVVRLSDVPVLTVKPVEVREGIIRKEDIENELHLR